MKKVLVVDDNEYMRENLQDFLVESFWVEVLLAQSVHEAKELMLKHSPALILCDFDMPEEDGGVFLSFLISKKILTPFIFFTGHDEVPFKEEIPIVGIVVQKNFNELMKVIESLTLLDPRASL